MNKESEILYNLLKLTQAQLNRCLCSEITAVMEKLRQDKEFCQYELGINEYECLLSLLLNWPR